MVDQGRTTLLAEDGGGSTDEVGGNGWQRRVAVKKGRC